jgi:hypothetical protein
MSSTPAYRAGYLQCAGGTKWWLNPHVPGSLEAAEWDAGHTRRRTHGGLPLDPALSGLVPVPGHAEGCGAHDDYACDCGSPAGYVDEAEPLVGTELDGMLVVAIGGYSPSTRRLDLEDGTARWFTLDEIAAMVQGLPST